MHVSKFSLMFVLGLAFLLPMSLKLSVIKYVSELGAVGFNFLIFGFDVNVVAIIYVNSRRSAWTFLVPDFLVDFIQSGLIILVLDFQHEIVLVDR